MSTVLLHPVCFPNVANLAAMIQNNVLWEVCDNFQKQTYRNRYYIATDQGKHLLSIPIKHTGKGDGRQKYANVYIDNSYPWQSQHWKTLQTAYRTSPFFEFYEDELSPLFHNKYEKLIDFNWATIHFFEDQLGIKIDTTHRTINYEKHIDLGLDQRNLVIAKNEKLTGFEPYMQVFQDRHNFIPNLSCLDLLFNEGPNSLAYLKSQKPMLNA